MKGHVRLPTLKCMRKKIPTDELVMFDLGIAAMRAGPLMFLKGFLQPSLVRRALFYPRDCGRVARSPTLKPGNIDRRQFWEGLRAANVTAEQDGEDFLVLFE